MSQPKIVLHTEPTKEALGSEGGGLLPKPPDGGALGLVHSTGFGTKQGSLMRTILFATERVTGSTAET